SMTDEDVDAMMEDAMSDEASAAIDAEAMPDELVDAINAESMPDEEADAITASAMPNEEVAAMVDDLMPEIQNDPDLQQIVKDALDDAQPVIDDALKDPEMDMMVASGIDGALPMVEQASEDFTLKQTIAEAIEENKPVVDESIYAAQPDIDEGLKEGIPVKEETFGKMRKGAIVFGIGVFVLISSPFWPAIEFKSMLIITVIIGASLLAYGLYMIIG
ncbi:MAG: hypothetical protein GW910_06385, partial [Candidatus Altiarchaeum hamiconexum]|nr:hypothetical protein [Candidatus Altarchaeum hamiconexum]